MIFVITTATTTTTTTTTTTRIGFAPANETEPFGFPGQIHGGMWSFVKTLIPQFYNDVIRIRPTKITISGHSLGSQIAALLGGYIRIHSPDIDVTVIGFGQPQIGDRAFSDWYSATVNSRRVTYLGSGFRLKDERKGLWFGVGDNVPQLPVPYETTPCKYCKGWMGGYYCD